MSDMENKNINAAGNGSHGAESYHVCNCPHGQYRTGIVFSWACIVFAFVFQLVGGYITSALTAKVWYAVVYYACCFLAYGLLVSLLVKISKGGKKILSDIYDSVMSKIPFATLLVIFLAIFGIASESVFAFALDKNHNIWAVILCFVLHLFSAFAVFTARLSLTGLPFKKEKDC